MKNRKKFTVTNYKDRHPRDEANILSHCLFWWPVLLLWKIRKNDNIDADFFVPVKNHESKSLGDKLEKFWKEEQTRKNPSLIRILIRAFGLKFGLSGLLYFPIDIAYTILQPLYLGKLLEYFVPGQTTVTKQQAYIFGTVIVAVTLLQMFAFKYFMADTIITGFKVRTCCCSLMYRNILRVRKATLQKVTLRKIVNLLSNDVDKFDRSLSYVHLIWIGWLKVVVVAYLIFLWFGVRATVGIGVLVLFLILQCFILRVIADSRIRVANQTDHRIRVMNDIICGIQTIKMYTWELPFEKLIQAVRRLELSNIHRSNQIQSANNTFASYLHKVPVYMFISLLVLTGNPLQPQTVFMYITVYDIVKNSLQFSVHGINQISEVKASICRIQTFLISNRDSTEEDQPRSHCIVAKNLYAKWDLESSDTLKNVNFEVKSGEIVAVVGTAGSGKSTLLQTILKQTERVGTLDVGGTISYASQEPWIFAATIKENIMFGDTPDEMKYRTVLRVCALEHDISLFPYGDNTLVGERGVMLSGGQKARVNLARAVYRNADFYLLDDPLAAVDASVATQIFTECVLGYLKTKTVVLVTHQLRFLRNMDRIYVLENGRVKTSGKYEQLQTTIQNLETYKEKAVEISTTNQKPYDTQYEVKETTGNKNINCYKQYFAACGWLAVAQIPLFVLSQIFINGSDMFLSFWINGDSYDWSFFNDINCLYIYGALLLGLVLLYHLSTWVFIKSCTRASKTLHDNLFEKVLRASMKFFDFHSSGRILNRFSADMGIVDETIPRNLYQLFRQSFACVGVGVVVVVVNYWIVVPTAVLYLLFYAYFKIFIPGLNKLKRVAATRRSPLYTHVSTTVQGLTTIKALKAETHSLEKFDDLQNCYSAIYYLQWSVYFAYSFWTDLTCIAFSAMVIYLLLFFENNLVGDVGLAITQSLLLTGTAQYAVRLYGELDSQMTSIERIVQYTDVELEEDTGNREIPKVWPPSGHIVYQNVSMQYSTDKTFVLKHVDLEIKAGEKIGIVGRTGAGKSSLISALLRLYPYNGTISIDGVDTKSVSLKSLRSKIAVIPQDPVFFLGTLRKNLDPFDEFNDHQLWSVLEDVKLKPFVSSLPEGLESLILESGANFSVGQRQMLCLVRAILKNSKIVVLDEATANVDLETDELIQSTIRRRFRFATVLTVAHRLNTVMDSDKILVMDDGRVGEFGTKEQLLQNASGNFYKYVHQK